LRSTSIAGWRAALKGQFGQEYADTKNFKRKFIGALKKATDAYKEARIETVTGGLKLLPSPPPVKRAHVLLPRERPKLIAAEPVPVTDKPPRHPERAFLGWVRKFTKGRRP
jgi:hypothetical protein